MTLAVRRGVQLLFLAAVLAGFNGIVNEVDWGGCSRTATYIHQ